MVIAILTTDNRQAFRQYDSLTPWFGTAPEALLQGFREMPGIKIHVISCAQRPMRSPEKLADNIWFHSLHVPRIGWLRTFYQGCVRAIRKKLREIQPDIVHGQGSEKEAAISAAFSGFPNVITIHGNMKAIAEFYRAPFGSYYWLAGKLETMALRRTDGVLCNSGYTESLVAPRAKNVWRVPNALRSQFFSSRAEHPKNFRPILLNIGIFEPRKRQIEILGMARSLWKRGLRFEIHFVSHAYPGAVNKDEFFKQLAIAEAEGYARHLGLMEIGPLVAAMDAADALVHFPTEEAFGLVVAEALARNLKLFAASVGGIVDIASGLEEAELFPVNDFAALENSIARWINSGCVHPVKAAGVMRQRYSPEVVARRHLEIYGEVLNRRL